MSKCTRADVIVAPDVADNSYMEYDLAEFFIEEGYRAAMAAMDDIRAGLLRLESGFSVQRSAGPSGRRARRNSPEW